jgi:2,3,4,5-tetrahydropyridine-2,6-dicarboxylate N-succinyltransferase
MINPIVFAVPVFLLLMVLEYVFSRRLAQPVYRAADTVTYGRIPAGSVVVSGNLPKAGGKYSMYCAVIVKRVDAKTRATTSLNDLLRD